MLLAMVITTIVQEDKLGILRHEVMEIKSEVAVYAAKIAVVEELTAKRKDIVERINLIEKLDHDRFLRLHILDEINRALPRLTWLTSVREEVGGGPGITFTIYGVTSSNLKVAELMGNLVTSPYLTNVDYEVYTHRHRQRCSERGAASAAQGRRSRSRNTRRSGRASRKPLRYSGMGRGLTLKMFENHRY